jgi:hypothetical protein
VQLSSPDAAQRREVAFGSGITALPSGKPFGCRALKITADIEIWTCGWMTAAVATCQRLAVYSLINVVAPNVRYAAHRGLK